jgi:hypothetical protein
MEVFPLTHVKLNPICVHIQPYSSILTTSLSTLTIRTPKVKGYVNCCQVHHAHFHHAICHTTFFI